MQDLSIILGNQNNVLKYRIQKSLGKKATLVVPENVLARFAFIWDEMAHLPNSKSTSVLALSKCQLYIVAS